MSNVGEEGSGELADKVKKASVTGAIDDGADEGATVFCVCTACKMRWVMR